MNDLSKKITSLVLSTVITASGITYAVVKKPMKGITTPVKETTQSVDDVEKDMTLYNDSEDSEIVDIPDFAQEEVKRTISLEEERELTIGDLRKVKRLILVCDDSADLSWLNYCTNLTNLVINGDIANNMDQIIQLENLQKLSLYTRDAQIEKNYKKLSFLRHCSNLEKLEINDDFDPKHLKELVNVKNLIIHEEAYLHSIRDLDFVENLTICDGQYDIAIKLSTDDIKYLEEKGVNIIIDNPNFSLADLKRISKQLDDIIESLNIDEKANDEEKINEVLIYCLEHLEYSEEIREKNDSNAKITSEDAMPFYEKGRLYGALDRDDQICGNYEALMEALLYRLGVNSYAMNSETHTWNLIEVDGEYYYYDATWLDDDGIIYSTEENDDELGSKTIIFDRMSSEEVIRSEDQDLLDQLTWYKVKPSDYESSPEKYEEGQIGSHKADSYQLIIERVKSEEKENNPAESMYEVTIGNKKYMIAGGALFGLLSALGIVVSTRKKKSAKKIREINQFYGYNQNDYNSSYSSNDYEPFKWGK